MKNKKGATANNKVRQSRLPAVTHLIFGVLSVQGKDLLEVTEVDSMVDAETAV